MSNKCVIICQLIVHLLVIVQKIHDTFTTVTKYNFVLIFVP